MLELEIIDALCRGIDPRTGENLNTPRDPKVDKLRLSFLDALKRLDKAVKKSGSTKIAINQNVEKKVDAEHPNRGKAWTETEEQKLQDYFTQGMTLEAMEPYFGRNAGALGARLVKLGVVKDFHTLAEENIRRGGSYGKGILESAAGTSVSG